MKSLQPANDNFAEYTREFWRPRVGRDLGREDARQIIQNVTGFFSILTEWSRAEMGVPANDRGKRSMSGAREGADES